MNPPPPTEDRGRIHWIYATTDWMYEDSEKHWASFEPPPGLCACVLVEVSVPIGWSLAPSPTSGVILISTFGVVATASLALEWGRRGVNGFKLKPPESGRPSR